MLGYSAFVLPNRLLWDPLPDDGRLPVAGPRRFRRLRDLADAMTAYAAVSRLPVQELVDRRVRRGRVQALVKEAFQLTVAEQDTAHRGPVDFAEAWRERLGCLLGQDCVDLPGWSLVTIAEVDSDFAWKLYEAASSARQHAIGQAKVAHSRRVQWGSLHVQTFEFAITSEGGTLGEVRYGICPPCGVGLLYKISFDPEWQFCGLGRLALGQLEARHPDLTWYTTGQFRHARGFYDRYRRDSNSPWTDRQHLCPHFD